MTPETIEQARTYFTIRAKHESVHETQWAALDARRDFYDRWPPEGYGTYARLFQLEDGRWVLLGWHADSCE